MPKEIIRLNEEEIKDELKKLVRGSVEEPSGAPRNI